MVQACLSELVGIHQILYRENGLSKIRLRFFDIQTHLTAHHQPGDLMLIQIGDLIGAHGLSVPQDGHAVAESLYLVQFMRNKNNGMSAFF